MKFQSFYITVLYLFLTFSNSIASIISSTDSPMAISLGGAFGPIADDGSALFLNPAGPARCESPGFYLDCVREASLGPSRSVKLSIALPVRRFVFASGWYRGSGDGHIEDRISMGVSRMLIKGTVGSFLSTGMTVDFARVAIDDAFEPGGDSRSGYTASFGVMLRPLPVFSFSCSILNAGGVEFKEDDVENWPRSVRWGAAYFWRQKVSLVFEQDRRGGEVYNRYGFILKTSLPVELMGGFYRERVSAGVRWSSDTFSAICAFSSNRGSKITISLGIEYTIGKKEDKGYTAY